MQDIRWGSIGCGDVMEVKSGPALQNVVSSDLIGVMRRDGRLAEDFARRHGVEKWYDDATKLVNDPDINAIYIATPPDTHLEYTRMAAQAGKPVYVEKPMANSFAECQEMIQVCQNQGVPLFVAYYRRALPRFLKVKEIIKSGQLGIIKEVQVQLLQSAKEVDISGKSNWRVNPNIAGCGYFCDLGSHIFDLLQFLLGDISEASGNIDNTGKHYEAEDFVEAEFQFESGSKGSGIWNFNFDRDIDKTKIIGTRGEVEYTHFAEADVTVRSDRGEDHFEIPNPLHIQQPLVQLIVDEIRGVGKSPSTGVTAARTNWVMDRVLGRIGPT
ncbi:MAG: Gfo/Idh/MocA family oxidoreductase [FCB group bacterium]|nr:Gfo/Idh/MocA family oxidoreductase [FCB group bacterium]MBL7123092.1 Gfo/Idh/MocA family oxidoreductase [Candidatus Neomarinimicrobiota bacterium]